ncbi:hypothetical protein N9960_01880 [Flavobacteriaceae bacterium]|jgi:YD repeat-containing protein|nr:hypothetical protein [Flavobacteriaceae bacterium]
MKHYFLLLLFFPLVFFGQTNYNNSLPSILPPSPTANEFLKYGEIPISKYTGTPNINIPIYTINAKGIDVPISLSYHSNGIKVSEEASNVGLGWTLNTGGSIVQVINGFDDFGEYQNRTFLDIDAIADVASGGSSPSGILDNCTGTVIGLSEYNFNIPGDNNTVSDMSCGDGNNYYSIPQSFVNGSLDFEPDVFKFNMLGYSGEFVLDWETGHFRCLTDKKMKIEESGNGFKIHVADGHKFVFEKMEESTFLVSYPTSSAVESGLVVHEEKASRIYKLVDIFTNKGDNIHYTYFESNYVTNLPSMNKSDVRYKSLGQGWGFPHALNAPNYATSLSITRQKSHYVSSIVFNNGVIQFNSSNRTDLANARKLDEILVRKNSFNGPIIKTFDFDFDYFIGHSSGRDIKDEMGNDQTSLTIINQKTSQELTHRLRLKSITEVGKKPYQFEYNSTQLPSKISIATDYWGNYSGYNSNQTTFPDITRFNVDIGNINYTEHNNNNKSPNETYLKAGILEKVIYPTKGYTIFDYEMHSFNNVAIPEYNSSSTNLSGLYYGAGLRIKKIENFDNNNSKVSSKKYTYNDGKLMTPMGFINYTFLAQYDGEYYPYGGGTDSCILITGRGHRITLSSSNYNTPSLTGNSNYVGYSEVVEQELSLENGTAINGKIVETYSNEELEGVFGNPQDDSQIANGIYRELRMPLIEKNNLVNGLLLEQTIFDNNDVLQRKTENTYNFNNVFGCTNGARISGVYRNLLCNSNVPYAFIAEQMLGVYPIKRTNSSLKDMKITEYLNNNTLESLEEFSYNSYTQLKAKKVTNSDGNFIIENYFRPHDFNEITHVSHGMKINHLLSPILEKDIEVNGDIVSIEKFDYEIVGSDNYQEPVNIYDIKKYHFGKLIGNNSDIEEIISYSKHDTFEKFGNVLEVKRQQGTPISYIWGYNGQYPVAKIEGRTYDSLPSSIVNNIENAPESTIALYLGQLRLAVSDALITTMTYNPLVGLKTVTDPRGYLMEYEYDDLERLQYVKDADGNILTKNEYNYKN